jgi:hypothetical protein
MTTSNHLQIVNPCYTRGEDVLFGQFLLLSPELRQYIWKIALKRYRLLEVEIEPASEADNAPPYSTKNALNNLISGQNYFATIQSHQLHSKLLRINRESREVALRFYRVHIPCYLQTSDGVERTLRTTLYFNPEFDFMHLKSWREESPFIDFLHDLKAYDPQNVGLLNLALDTNTMSRLNSLTNISETAARASFITFLSQLQQLIWVAHSHIRRGVIGLLDGFPSVGVQFNHSMPVKSTRPSFDLLERDPRPVGPELTSIVTACPDPRQMRVQWRMMLERWEIHQVQPTRERVLFSYDPPPYSLQVYDIRTANEFLKEEEARWLQSQLQRKGIIRKFAAKVPIEGPEELAKAVRPAIGFWLFPAEALGSLDENIMGMGNVFDMTGSWPELALSCIS